MRLRSKRKKISGRQIAEYYVQNNSTIRKTAAHFGISKTKAHSLLANFQTNGGSISPKLVVEVTQLVQKNLSERAIRGGMARKRKCLEKSN